jgi:hypothetical protein
MTPEQEQPKPSSSRRNAAASGAERRRWARAQSDLPITVTLAGGVSPARVRDVSRAGVCFFLDRPIPMMTVLDVAIEVKTSAGPRNIRGHGAVVRCERIAKAVDHWEVAVFLNDMSESDRRAMEEYVGSQPRQP